MYGEAETSSAAGPSVQPKRDTPCRYFYRSGSCKRGDKCQFSHDQRRQPGEPSAIARHPPASIRAARLSAQAPEFAPSSASRPRLSARAEVFEPSTIINDDGWEDIEPPPPSQPVVASHETEARPLTATVTDTTENLEPCGICMEVPTVFAQLSNCDHSFCAPCLREWRRQRQQDKSKHCPTCRTPSDFTFVTPQHFSGSARALAVKRFRDRAASAPCKNFTKSLALSNKRKKPFCPFGDDCLYQHNVNGQPHKFDTGRYRINRYRKGTRRLTRPGDTPAVRSEATISAEFFARIRDMDERVRIFVSSRGTRIAHTGHTVL